MNTEEKLKIRINQLIELADNVLRTERRGTGTFSTSYVDNEQFNEFRNASLSFILNLYTKDHPYYESFFNDCHRATPFEAKTGRGILTSIKTEIEQGWLNTIRGLLSAEIFTDFIEMAEHLLNENYKDASAVMIGSVLEEHLRQLCVKNGIDITSEKAGKQIPKRADLLNAELTKATIYNKLDQKNVTAWLDLRNKAAHGKYGEYTKEQVELMLQSVIDFMTRNGI
ncbi:DUF4145 domain-containing protein [Winogradskyella pacifica]|uniref:DUF4145 domain-containing protein n=1 Tax=Winogradskyella pacifica TaxID=664642 RepID=UPI0015CD06BB|nr:DUF4145 domain-containing protein [Winogradskyella pacifica]